MQTANDQAMRTFEKRLREILISDYDLPASAVDRIYSTMNSSDVSFGEAALQLGLVTAEALESALKRIGNDSPSLIMTALRKVSSDQRQLTVKHGEEVRPGEQLLLLHDPYNPRSEKIRALRTELLLLNEGVRQANVVPVLSPSAKEGRSQLAAELAVSFAQLGRRTLLVDADMRKPSQHLFFGSSNPRGLATSLSLKERPLFNPVAGLASMHLLTAGPTPENPLELLSDGRFENLLTEWRNAYEFIVIDTPPVSQYADGLAIATMAARVLIVSRAQHTSYKSTREMMRRLETTQSTILGAVLNKF